jgi:hypothetical protein
MRWFGMVRMRVVRSLLRSDERWLMEQCLLSQADSFSKNAVFGLRDRHDFNSSDELEARDMAMFLSDSPPKLRFWR